MKKINFLIFLTAALLVFTGCLKDKVNQPNPAQGGDDGVINAVMFTQTKVSAGVQSSTDPQVINNIYLSLNAARTQSTAVTNTIVSDPAKITDPALTPVDNSLFTFNTNAVVEAGKWTDTVALTLNTATLDPNLTYAIALTITGSSNGFQVAENSKTIIIVISVKNKYDGRYILTGYHNRVPYTFPYEVEMDMVTVSPNEVAFYWPDVDDYGHPIGVGPNNSLSWYGNTMAPVIKFNSVTNVVTDVYNGSPGGTAVTLFTGPDSFPSYYDPATKTIYVCWNYGGNPLRAFFDTLVYEEPRP